MVRVLHLDSRDMCDTVGSDVADGWVYVEEERPITRRRSKWVPPAPRSGVVECGRLLEEKEVEW